MIEAKLLVGRYLKFTPPKERPIQLGRGPQFEHVNCTVLQIEESQSRSIGKRESNVSAGPHVKVHRNFKFLPYYHGDISNTDFTCDVLTGPMSGCILVSYKDSSGTRLVGHVGTVDLQPVVNAAVKTLWNNFATANPGNIVGGFNPADPSVADPTYILSLHKKGDMSFSTWGLFTISGEFYTVIAACQSFNRDDWRIAAVHKVPSMTLAQLQSIP
jgi:hypothetical protein